jgi:hypothetical protein
MFREALAELLAERVVNFAKCWSEWQDLNLRPPRPERQGTRHLPRTIDDFHHVRVRSFTIGCRVSLAILWRTIECVTGPAEIVRMMVPVVVEQGLERHPEIFGDLPWVAAKLHQPSRGRVPENVRGHIQKPNRSPALVNGLADLPFGARPYALLSANRPDHYFSDASGSSSPCQLPVSTFISVFELSNFIGSDAGAVVVHLYGKFSSNSAPSDPEP